MKKIILSIIFICLILGSLTSGAEISYFFERNSNINLKLSCVNETNGLCSSTATWNITILYPNHSLLVDNKEMTWNKIYYNYSMNSTYSNKLGVYTVITNCYGTCSGYTKFLYEITPTGQNISESQGFTSMGLILSILAIAFLFMYFGFKFVESDKLFPVGLFFMLISLLLSVYTIHLGYIYSRDMLYPLAGEGTQFKVYLGIMWGLLGMAFLTMLGLILKTLKEFRERKSMVNYGEGWDQQKQSYN